jgi:hypothetical protein
MARCPAIPQQTMAWIKPYINMEVSIMKSSYALMAIASSLVLNMSAATPVLAEQYGGNWNDKNMASDSKELGEHHMDGTVTKVNHRTGFITVKTEEGLLRLHYPPKSIKDIKDGNKIRLYLGYSELSKKM